MSQSFYRNRPFDNGRGSLQWRCKQVDFFHCFITGHPVKGIVWFELNQILKNIKTTKLWIWRSMLLIEDLFDFRNNIWFDKDWISIWLSTETTVDYARWYQRLPEVDGKFEYVIIDKWLNEACIKWSINKSEEFEERIIVNCIVSWIAYYITSTYKHTVYYYFFQVNNSL